MLRKYSPLWVQDRSQMLATLLTLLFLVSLYLGFML